MTIYRKGGLVLAVMLALLAFAHPAHAGRMFAWAESAQFPTNNVGCSKNTVRGSTYAYTTVACNDEQVGRFQLRGLPFPPDATTASWTYTVWYESAYNGVCAWDVKVGAIPSGDTSAATDTGLNVASSDSGNISRTPGARYVAGASSATNVIRVNGLGTCATLSDCTNTDLMVMVVLDTTNTTATNCEFVMLDVSYP